MNGYPRWRICVDSSVVSSLTVGAEEMTWQLLRDRREVTGVNLSDRCQR